MDLARVEALWGNEELLLESIPDGIPEGHLHAIQASRNVGEWPKAAELNKLHMHLVCHSSIVERTLASGAPRPGSWMMSVTTPLM